MANHRATNPLTLLKATKMQATTNNRRTHMVSPHTGLLARKQGMLAIHNRTTILREDLPLKTKAITTRDNHSSRCSMASSKDRCTINLSRIVLENRVGQEPGYVQV